MTIDKLLELDFVSVLDLEEKETIAMNIMNAVEVDGGQFLLATIADNGWDEEDEAEEAEDDSEDAYVFKICPEDEAQFLLTEDYSEIELFVTTEFPEGEFYKAAEALSNTGAYELEIEESDDNE